jgi:mannitol/fructose-specific phosphotransferase system IIA component (Ntr-type)
VPGLAVPHILVDRDGVFEMIIARCREGVTFPDPDTRARILFILVGSKGDRSAHLRILSAIAQLFQDASFEDSLLSVDSTEKMREVLLSVRRRRF